MVLAYMVVLMVFRGRYYGCMLESPTDDQRLLPPTLLIQLRNSMRIERWWGILRQCKADFWIDHFKTLESDGHLVRGNRIHLLCLQFVYIPFIQNHLGEVVEMWNSHNIRRQKMGDVINGIPDILFSNPEITGAEDCLSPTTEEEIQDLRELCQNNYTELDPDFIRIVQEVTETCQIPNAAEDFATARNLFIVLSEVITKLYHQM